MPSNYTLDLATYHSIKHILYWDIVVVIYFIFFTCFPTMQVKILDLEIQVSFFIPSLTSVSYSN